VESIAEVSLRERLRQMGSNYREDDIWGADDSIITNFAIVSD
jgi:hypothetical protein